MGRVSLLGPVLSTGFHGVHYEVFVIGGEDSDFQHGAVERGPDENCQSVISLLLEVTDMIAQGVKDVIVAKPMFPCWSHHSEVFPIFQAR
ncbi:hypothetical protein HGQ17_11595 [Nesterenkonia sp. MY13]|uniref:Uncharacterized protein n=1 Tax=Nesterenkonia sedimenti TaxID=1463632 RepID=A0A7X8TLL0_9MICC|nr:hypothetical protein [Nesterenkonia sedimenti]NLS10622.1 hypothetical protein [Nesterenkonia sedimenti]